MMDAKLILYILIALTFVVHGFSCDLVSVSRWRTRDGGTFIRRDDKINLKWFSARGYTDRRNLYYAYKTKPDHDVEIAVKSVKWHVKTVNGTDDWVAAMDGAVSDNWWTSRRHSGKMFEGWVFKSQPLNPPLGYVPVKVNRWDDTQGNWVTAAEGSKEESELIFINARHKSFLFWALRKEEEL